MTEPPVACALDDAGRRRRREEILRAVLERATEVRTLDEGYAFRFPPDDSLLHDLAQVIDLERRCCEFLRFLLTVEPGGGPIRLEVTGPAGTREFLRAELGFDVRGGPDPAPGR